VKSRFKHRIPPGAFIEWLYNNNDKPVSPDEEMSSLPYDGFMHIGSNHLHMLVAIYNEGFDTTIVWVNDMGLFRSRLKTGVTRIGLYPVRPRQKVLT